MRFWPFPCLSKNAILNKWQVSCNHEEKEKNSEILVTVSILATAQIAIQYIISFDPHYDH